ncbi:OmpH family outer membrane protein [Bizionia sediminis]|uniref:OmpH family outer membrane protein n=1 Tax=Bizionia sediminis TaxID=1737064 RepID=A0ABW5KUC0_9FLAO
MKKNFLVLFAVLVTVLSCNTNSEKIGFVNNSELINTYQEKIDMEAALKLEIEAFQKRTDSISQAFQKEAQGFQIKAQGMKPEAAQAEYQILGQKQQMLQQRIQQEESEIQQRSQASIDTLIKKVRTFVKDYGKQNGYTFILGSNEAGSVMYGKDEYDLTKIIAEALNAAYKEAK